MKKLLTTLISFLIVFSIFAFGITYYAISNFNNTSTLTGIDLNSTYDTNKLLIDHTYETYNGIEVEVPRINGLKDSLVQDKINNDIIERVDLLLDKYPEFNYCHYYAQSNFANVISIAFTVGFDQEPYYEAIYLNYNLVDGNRLTFEDLFLPDTDILSLVREGFYKALSLYGNYDSESALHSPNEEQIYKLVKNYMASSDKSFAFSPTEIFLYSGDNMASITMLDHADDICIYTKYLTEEDIFTGEYPCYKNIFTCASSNYDVFDKIEYGLIEDNLWYDITVSNYYEGSADSEKATAFENFTSTVYKDFDITKDEYCLLAQNNPDKFYIVLAKPSVQMFTHSEYQNGEWQYNHSRMASVYNNTQVFEMPISLYESVYRDKIVETYRYPYFAMRGGAWLDSENLEGATFSQTETSTLYNYITGEQLTHLSDVFYEDSDYLTVIENEVKERLELAGKPTSYSISDMKLSLSGHYVKAVIEPIDFTAEIYFSSFDEKSMKLMEE